MKLTAKLLRKNIGNVLEWEVAHDHYRGTCSLRRGIIKNCEGRNVFFEDGNVEWFPKLINATIFEIRTTQNKETK